MRDCPVTLTEDILVVKEPPPSRGRMNTSPLIRYSPAISISGTVSPILSVLKERIEVGQLTVDSTLYTVHCTHSYRTVNLLHNLFLIPLYPKTATKLQRQLPIGNDMNKIIARHHHQTFVTRSTLYSEMTSTNSLSSPHLTELVRNINILLRTQLSVIFIDTGLF